MTNHNKLSSPHAHTFLSDHHNIHERRTWFVILLTLTTMIVEIFSGMIFGSMALLADGWHMASHASAMGITALAYYLSRRHADNDTFTFGTGKIGDLGGYSSALVLILIAFLMAYQSVTRLFNPVNISFDEAILVAIVGLIVNIASAFILKENHGHPHHEDDHDNGEHHQDHNLRAAYLHVLADALTSILAIIALVIGRFWGLVFLDPLMGIVGAIVICFWAWGLMKETASVLLDANPHPDLTEHIQKILKEQDPESIIEDYHIWRIGPGHFSAIISLVSANGSTVENFQSKLCTIQELSHVTVEVKT